MFKKNILITGGCRSGKTRQALIQANEFPGQRVFIATAEALDDEMTERIEQHRRERGSEWITVEEPLDIAETVKQNGKPEGVLVLDCLTLWVSNLLMKEESLSSILKRLDSLIGECSRANSSVIVITNEVGAGIVPDNKLSRDFRDIAGEVNQTVAAAFDEVVSMVSGIPTVIKQPDLEDPGEKKKLSPHEFSPTHKQGLYEAIFKRRDVRHFISKPVDPETLGRILNAAHHAGSVGYMQPWDFTVIDDPEIKTKIARNFEVSSATAAEKFTGDRKKLYQSLKLEGILDAPINICITCDRTRFGPKVLGRNSIPETDLFSTCCAVQNLWLAARVEGLAVGWVSILNTDQLKKDLEIPDHIIPVAYLCIGHTETFYKKPMLEEAGWGKRLSLKKLISYNKWHGKPKGFSVVLPDENKT